ncbi:Fic family protein [Candidatus Poriferisodalis sp.]|uniref:Fic family protein n=1 Tax=Candidatus Poriferisodalis sp. TaxID=3101277 RepID=UPI003B02E379
MSTTRLRSPAGEYVITSVGGEEVRAFVPAPLAPDPPLQIDGPLITALDEASRALGRFDGAIRYLPNKDLLIYSYIRKEALLSSQIEGTQSSLSDLMQHELDATPGVPLDDVMEVSTYVAAIEHAAAQMTDPSGLPLCNRLLRQAHGILLSTGRGADKHPGEFRTSQNWIDGKRPGTAAFVPPPAPEAQKAISGLEKFLHADDGLPPLLRAGLAHVQFETIHPFLDGNGRIGRMLITLLLLDRNVLSTLAFYPSLYLKQNRSDYYEMLNRVRLEGDWRAWLLFFLEGIRSTAEAALSATQRLEAMAADDRNVIEQHTGKAAGSALRVHATLMQRPVLNVETSAHLAGLSWPAVNNALTRLSDLGIVSEVTGQRRNRVFVYSGYLAVLEEGTEPL